MSMHQEKPTLPKGMRDFGPAQMLQRNELFNVIKHDFQKYGFLPLETPALENLAVLQGKYGAEGDQLLFKVLNSGNFYQRSKKKILNKTLLLYCLKFQKKGCATTSPCPWHDMWLCINRTYFSFQKISNTTGMACRSSAKRPIPRILSMRC